MTSGKTADQWADEFLRVRSRFVDFSDELARLIPRLLEHEQVAVAQVDARTKTPESLAEKIERKNDKYVDPLTEITDLVGARIILYYPADVEVVGKLVEREFDIDWKNSVRRGADVDPDRFGYRSDHYVVALSAARLGQPEWSRFAGLRAEIQVRTVMQHAWAAVDHKIRYKKTDLPVDLQRRLSRLSALLEVADEQFAALRDASQEASDTYSEAVAAGELDVSVDALSLRAFLDETKLADTWTARAVASGFEPLRRAESSPSQRRERKDFQRLLHIVQGLGFTTLSEIQTKIESIDSIGDDLLQSLVHETKAASDGLVLPGTIFAAPTDVVALVLLARYGNAKQIDDSGYRPDIRAGLNATRKRLGVKANRSRSPRT